MEHVLESDIDTIIVKYRRKLRNPAQCHVVLQLSPRLWQEILRVGRLFIDMQSVHVEDQTPLIQCTRCLRFGHGRKSCTAEVESCTHCCGPHQSQMSTTCPEPTPICNNCLQDKLLKTEHSVFSKDCPTRHKWDTIARARVAYHPEDTSDDTNQ